MVEVEPDGGTPGPDRATATAAADLPVDPEPTGWDRLRPRLTPESWYAFKLIAPALAMMFVVHFVPIVWGIVISFMRVDAAYISHWYDAPFVGLANYRTLLDPTTVVGSRYWYSLRQTLIFGAGSVAGIYGLGLVTALALNRKFRGRLAVRTLILVPWVAPVVVTLLTWRMMLLSDSGIVNHLLLSAGLIDEPVFWLVGKNAIWAIIIANVWRNFPWAAIMLYAGLQSIPEHLYEAASVDGAGRWQRFRYITMPQLKPVSVVILLLMMLWSFINFTVPYVLLGQTASDSAEVLMLFTYNYAFRNFAFGLGAAMSVVLLVFAMALALVYYRQLIGDAYAGAHR